MTTEHAEEYLQIDLDDIVPSPTNPRTTFDPAYISSLAVTIKADRVHQAITVRPLPASRMEETFANRRRGAPLPSYEIVFGECRWRGSKEAEKKTIPAMVRRDLTDADVARIQLIENLEREDLNALDEAHGYQRLVNEHKIKKEDIGDAIGKSRSYVYHRLKLLDLCQQGQAAMKEGQLDITKAVLIARIPNEKLQIQALEDLVNDYEHFSFREAQDYIQRKFMLNLSAAKFPIKDETLCPDAGSCKSCPKRTGAEPELFEDVKGVDVCTDPPCYRAKDQAWAERQMAEATANGQTVISGREAKALMPNSWTNRVDGYLRLDAKEDSPTDKPLRNVIGKQMEKAGIKPVLIANPHKEGELIAVLPADKVADLLREKGSKDAAEKLNTTRKANDKEAARREAEKAKDKVEGAWRWAVLEAAWAKVQAETAGLSSGAALDEVTRHLAMRKASSLNQDRAKRLCALLGLGKVAPTAAVSDWVKGHPTPGAALLLLVMESDVEYHSWQEDEGNAGLWLVAAAMGVDRKAIEAETKANARAEAKKKKEDKPSPPLSPAAPAKAQLSKAQPKGKGKPVVAPKAKKMTAKEATSGIAAAMQGIESAPGGAEDGAVDAWPFPGGGGLREIGLSEEVGASE